MSIDDTMQPVIEVPHRNGEAGCALSAPTCSLPVYYEDKYVRLYHGSSVESLPECFAPECVVTDPPYGVGFQYENYKDTPENFDAVRQLLHHLAAHSTQMALMMSMRQLWTMPNPKWMLCWAKPGSCRRSSVGGFSEWEPVLLYGKGWKISNDLKILPDCVNHSKDAARGHPCPKPIKLMTWIVSLTKGVVCDPFAGSGTTLLAAKQLERKAVGWEIEERYCEIIANRLAQGVLKLTDCDAWNDDERENEKSEVEKRDYELRPA